MWKKNNIQAQQRGQRWEKDKVSVLTDACGRQHAKQNDTTLYSGNCRVIFTLRCAVLTKRKQILLPFLFYSANHCLGGLLHTSSWLCAAAEELITLPTLMVMTHETRRWPAASLCEEELDGEGWWEGKKGNRDSFWARGSLKMQEGCYSTQTWPLFPACIQCLGNTKLIVTAQRGISEPFPPLVYNPWPHCCLLVRPPFASLASLCPYKLFGLIFLFFVPFVCFFRLFELLFIKLDISSSLCCRWEVVPGWAGGVRHAGHPAGQLPGRWARPAQARSGLRDPGVHGPLPQRGQLQGGEGAELVSASF